MKKLMLLTVMLTTMLVKTTAMTYSQARQEALFLTDKMAYELRLSREQCEAVYEINIDYLMAIDSRSSLYGWAWERRNSDLRFVLTAYQYQLYMEANYFYRPVGWRNNSWRFRIYKRYSEHTIYYSAPIAYRSYRGGNNGLRDSYYAHRNFNQPTNFGPTTVLIPANNGTTNHGKNSTSGATTSWRSGNSGHSSSSTKSGSSWRASQTGGSTSTRSSSGNGTSSTKKSSNNSSSTTTSGGQFKGKR